MAQSVQYSRCKGCAKYPVSKTEELCQGCFESPLTESSQIKGVDKMSLEENINASMKMNRTLTGGVLV